jgi:O-antigen ligase
VIKSKSDFLEYSVLSFGLIPLLPNRLKGLPVALLLLAGLLNFRRDSKLDWKSFLINSSLFFAYLFSILFINSEGSFYKIIERSFSILIIPFVFHLFIHKRQFDVKIIHSFFKVFIVASAIFSLIIILGTLTDSTTVYYQDWYTNKARTVMENFPTLGQHPIYGSLFFGLSVLFCFELLNQKGSKKIWISLLVFHILSLIFFLSKGIVIGLFIALIILILSKLKITKRSLTYVMIIGVLFSSLFIFNRRMREMISFKTYEKVDTNYSNSIRIGIYDCVFEILDEHWLLGVGVGNVQTRLNHCYQEKSDVLLQKLYNSHNQFFDIWLKTGIIGLLIFFGFLVFHFKRAIIHRNYFLIAILIYFIIIFFTENLLSRQTGIILFFFLIPFFSRKIATLEAE